MGALIPFSTQVKSELCGLKVTDQEAVAELVGFLKGRGELSIGAGVGVINIRLGSVMAVRRCYALSHYLSPREKHADIYREMRLSGRNQGVVTLRFDEPMKLLEMLGLSVTSGDIPSWIVGDIYLLGAFLRGLFVSSGSIADPHRHYHLEIVNDSDDLLLELKKLLRDRINIKAGVLKYRHGYKLYVKKGSDIVELLNLMGAEKSASEMEQLVTLKQISGDVSRSYNFLAANAERMGTSNSKQISAIVFLLENDLLDDLPSDLARLARLRLENEDLSLAELGRLYEPPMYKSMVYNRLKKIMKIARENGWNQPTELAEPR